jgi:hypothetical protein
MIWSIPVHEGAGNNEANLSKKPAFREQTGMANASRLLWFSLGEKKERPVRLRNGNPKGRCILVVVFILGFVGCRESKESELSGSPPESFQAQPMVTAAPQELSASEMFQPPDGLTPSSTITVTAMEKWPYRAPRFSPDGSRFLAYGDNGLVVGSSDATSAGSAIVSEETASSAAWAPDSNHLVLSLQGDDPNQPSPIVIVSADGSSSRQVASTTRPADVEFLKTGAIAYAADTRLLVTDAASGDTIQLQGISVDTDPVNQYPFSISPDGQAVALLGGGTRGSAGGKSLTIVDVASGAAVQVANSVNIFGAAPYRWSDDGRHLFYSYTNDSGAAEIAAYDRINQATALLVSSGLRGNYAGMSFNRNTGWLLFAHFRTGTNPEESTQYQALNIFTGTTSLLFVGGIGLNSSPDGSRMGLFKTGPDDAARRGSWVAHLSF